MADFKSHLPVQTHKDGVSFTPGSEYIVTVGAYESISGTINSLTMNAEKELFVVDKTMRDALANEDAAFSSGDRGMHVLAVRQDVLAPSTDADGDYSSLKVDANGALYIYGKMSLEIEVAEDEAHVSGQKGILAMAVRNDSNAEMTDADGDNTPLTTDKTGAMRVTVVDPTKSNTEHCDYQTEISLAVGASVSHSFTVPVGKTLKLDDMIAAASGRIKAELIVDTDVKYTSFNSTSRPEIKFECDGKIEVPEASVLIVKITNLDEDDQDVYSTTLGYLL